MKRLLLILVLFFGIAPVSFAQEYFYINNYDIDMTVDEKNYYLITETIDVSFTQSRHGIFRDIPRSYKGDLHEIEVLSVTGLDGEDIPYQIKDQGNEMRIIIGDKDRVVQGNQRYTITYKYYWGDDFNKEFDQVYFNLVGLGWDTYIENVRFRVQMPKTFPIDTLNVTKGPEGSTNKADWGVDGLTVTGHAKNLHSHEGVTFRVDMPEGYFKFEKREFPNWLYTRAFAILGATTGIAFLLKKTSSKVNEVLPVTSIHPPFDLNPAEINYIYSEEGGSFKDMSSFMMYWANKGYLNIHQQGSGQLKYEKLVESSVIQEPYEKKLFEDLFSYGDGKLIKTSQLKGNFSNNLAMARKGMIKKFGDQKKILEPLYKKIPNILKLLLFFGSAILLAFPFSKYFGVVFSQSIFTILVAQFIWNMIINLARKRFSIARSQALFKSSSKRTLSGDLWFAFWSVFIGILLPFLAYFFHATQIQKVPWSQLGRFVRTIHINDRPFWLLLLGFIVYLFTHQSLKNIKKYTAYAKEVLGPIQGFRNFIEIAKLDEIEALVEKYPNYYFDVLPYAYALNLTDKWSQHFDGLSLESPTWYEGTKNFRVSTFTSSYTSNVSSITRPSESSVGSSSSDSYGGGGSSGGGGGGGGGGSW